MEVQEKFEKLIISEDDSGKGKHSLVIDEKHIDEKSEFDFANLELTDITDYFDKLGKNVSPSTIIKTPSFDLFDGTHSLEVSNDKLDSSLIKLSKTEINFDCNKVHGSNQSEKLSIVSGIADRLLRSVISWLSDYQTLPSTVLSCRYLEWILVESAKAGKTVRLTTGDILYDDVLSGCLIGIGYFAKFIFELLKAGVIFEEEDLNFHYFGLTFLSHLKSPYDVFPLLDKSIKYLEELPEDTSHLEDIIKVIKNLITIETHVTLYSAETDHLESIKILAKRMQVRGPQKFIELEGAFSMGIQKRKSNHFPTRNLVEPSENYDKFITMATDIEVVIGVATANDALETFQFAYYFNKLKQRHVLARAIFPLFLMRNDQTVLGKIRIDEFLKSHLELFSFDTNKEYGYTDCESGIRIEEGLQEGMNIIFEMYQNFSQNTCRYSQGLNRQVKFWDSLQAHFEEGEAGIFKEGLSDKIEETGGEFYPFAAWAYSMKLMFMCEYILKNFELDIFKPSEAGILFWHVFYLQFYLQKCLTETQSFINSKITHINNMPKRIKKLKAGSKKETMRANYMIILKTKLPKLQRNLKHITFLLKESTIIQSMCNIEIFQFVLLKKKNMIDVYLNLKNLQHTSEELMYNLRFKPFSSIAAPPKLDFETFVENAGWIKQYENLGDEDAILKRIGDEAASVSKDIDEILNEIDGNGSEEFTFYSATNLVKEESSEFFRRIKVSAQAIKINSKISCIQLNKKPTEELHKTYRVEFKVGDEASCFFPLLSLVPKVSWKNRQIEVNQD